MARPEDLLDGPESLMLENAKRAILKALPQLPEKDLSWAGVYVMIKWADYSGFRESGARIPLLLGDLRRLASVSEHNMSFDEKFGELEEDLSRTVGARVLGKLRKLAKRISLVEGL